MRLSNDVVRARHDELEERTETELLELPGKDAATGRRIADDAERRWAENGYTEKQKKARRARRPFVINAEGKHVNTFVNENDSVTRNRLKLDRVVDELNEQRRHREVWDE